ncbi:hypothetical protein NG800_012955 [Epilithonimonas ginsengisoli]|uniref:Uncharacterized protein n=1 Tax=Epilithonimonas ginsengisoli TaxID=1245592 RepID=A0ABU4JJP4_9FLAO|nr:MULTISPECIES: hypothetical protein [Chryseobacterium group]MBV6880938.1 hypothetical protein [Epilithonimonas sp. FP105]MDW8549827.1 hypothetical protein [Epilithonimonas ginsengisoli]OAH73582.1 hypothetical protein AXA65_07540 [Chryseobacterium sp. FP211-J200]
MKKAKNKMKSNTSIPDINIDRLGTVTNIRTNKIFKVGKRGYFTYKDKPINLAKLMLETFKKIPIRNGHIIFKDGNKKNYNLSNLEYQTKLSIVEPPTETDIINVINYYCRHDKMVNLRNAFKYRVNLLTVLSLRNFFIEYKGTQNLDVFKDYAAAFAPGFYTLSKKNNITVLESKRTIYYFLNKLIADCKNEGAILKD